MLLLGLGKGCSYTPNGVTTYYNYQVCRTIVTGKLVQYSNTSTIVGKILNHVVLTSTIFNCCDRVICQVKSPLTKKYLS